MFGSFGGGFSQIDVLLGNHIGILSPDVPHPFEGDLLDLIVGIGLLEQLLDFRGIEDGQQLAFLDHVAFIGVHRFQVAGHLGVQSGLEPWRHIPWECQRAGQIATLHRKGLYRQGGRGG